MGSVFNPVVTRLVTFFNVTPKTNAIDEEIRKLRDSLGETGKDPYTNKMKKNATRRRNDDN
ncbi:unnamed protein product [Malus baccata var. baccata]